MTALPKYEQAADWLMDLFGRTAIEPRDMFMRLLKNEPAMFIECLSARAPNYLADAWPRRRRTWWIT